MDQQINESTQNSKKIWIIIVTVIITALIMGISVFVLQNYSSQLLQTRINDLENKILEEQKNNEILRQKIEEFEKKAEEEPLGKIENKFKKTQAESNMFKLDKVKVGDAIAGMTITSIEPYNPSFEGLTPQNARIIFSGRITINGEYKRKSLWDTACFYPAETDQILFPKMEGDDTAVLFCFKDQNFATFFLGEQDRNATITIANYTINNYPSQVFDSADLVMEN